MLNNQQGIGLLEVMIAVLLLAVAVLGFSAMQMRAIKATDETLYRSDAMVAIRNIAEDMRLYKVLDRELYIECVNEISKEVIKKQQADLSKCSETDATGIKNSIQLAKESGVEIKAHPCAGGGRTTTGYINHKVCLYASWGDTTPEKSDNENACTDSDGVYKAGATCFVMETY